MCMSVFCGNIILIADLSFLFSFTDDNIDETYGVNVQFESDEEVRVFCWYLECEILKWSLICSFKLLF